METIVVGVDGSPASLTALRWAQALAGGAGAVVRVVHSWAPAMAASAMSITEVELEEEARRQVETALAEIPAGRVERHTAIVRDISAAAALLAQSEDADLLITGTRGLNRFERLLLGSVAVQCAQHAPCPFVAVPDGSAMPGGPITVGYDDSASSRDALRWATTWTGPPFSGVQVVAVPEAGGWWSRSATAQSVHEATQELRTQVRDVIGDAVEHVTLHVTDGSTSVVDALVDASEGSSVLAVGSRGLGGFKGLLLGSVSQRCLETSQRPVAIVRNLH